MKNFFLCTIFLNTVFAFVLAGNEILLYHVKDEVPAGTYKYYHFSYKGLIKIELKSYSGDADLYVSQAINKPSYQLDEHCLSSVTCGEDQIYIPESFKRPVAIGVYGHLAHQPSRYSLYIYDVDKTAGKNDIEVKPLEKAIYPEDSKSIFWSSIGTFLGQVFAEVLDSLF